MRSVFNKNPDELTDDEFSTLVTEALFLKDLERQQMEVAFEKSLNKILKILYPPKDE